MVLHNLFNQTHYWTLRWLFIFQDPYSTLTINLVHFLNNLVKIKFWKKKSGSKWMRVFKGFDSCCQICSRSILPKVYESSYISIPSLSVSREEISWCERPVRSHSFPWGCSWWVALLSNAFTLSNWRPSLSPFKSIVYVYKGQSVVFTLHWFV